MATPRKPQDHQPAKKAPAKKAPAKKAASTSRRPVDFDLDTLEREGEVLDPFTFRHGGKTFTLTDPAELELADLVEIGGNPLGNPILLRRLMGEHYDEIVTSGSMPQWKLIPLVEAWFDYYGLAQPGKSDA